MLLSNFNYKLPKELIAYYPAVRRDASRLLVVDRNHDALSHKKFTDIKNYLHTGDVLVLNNTRVIPARLHGELQRTGAHIEVLLVRKIRDRVWKILLRPRKKVRNGDRIIFAKNLSGDIMAMEKENIMRFKTTGTLQQAIEKYGSIPLPPYIKRPAGKLDRIRYQTVYAKSGNAVAAPTAGLHFTKKLLATLAQRGVKICTINLEVGLGTFAPIQTDNFANHRMHTERFHIPKETATIINHAKKQGRRVIACGTTVVRALESAATKNKRLQSGEAETKIFIYPPYKFEIVDALITNFHLPKSTLLILVSAFTGKDLILCAYKKAIKHRYRFFSYGDAMFIM